MDIGRLTAEFDTDDPDVVDAAAEMALLWVNSARLSEAARVVDWVKASPTPASPFRQSSIATANAWLDVVEGRFEAAVEHARAGYGPPPTTTPAGPRRAYRRSSWLWPWTSSVTVAARSTSQRASAAGVVAPRWIVPFLQLSSVLTLFRRGDWDDALAEADAGLLAAEESDLGLGVFWPYAVGALVACARGQQAIAHQWLDRSQAITAGRALGREWLAYAHAIVGEADGDTARAASLLAFATERIVGVGVPAFLLNVGADSVRLALVDGATPTWPTGSLLRSTR